jgi:hypothetical protein
MQRVRIFISSPGDVADERQRALAVVKRLQPEFDGVLSLEPLLWEQEPLLATADFQSQIRSPADFDIFATIIGRRLGSPLGLQFTRQDGSTYSSGTEFEFEMAVAGYHASGKPELLFYRKSLPADEPVSPQLEKVSAFFRKWFAGGEDGTTIGAYHTFSKAEEFEVLFTEHLRHMLHRFIPRPNNIPAPISSFVGRIDLISTISSLIRRDDVRLVSLFGAKGAGKSRLGLRTVRGLLGDFEDGVFLLNLEYSDQENLLPEKILAALEITPQGDRPVIDSVVAALEDKEMLLLVDDFEIADAAVADITALLTRCPGIKFIVTGREELRVGDSHGVLVPPMALPDPDSASFAEIRDSEAVQLFIERAKVVRENFELTEENAGEVLQICSQLQALPFTIELATSRMRSMTTTKLLRSLASIKVKDETGNTIYLIPR